MTALPLLSLRIGTLAPLGSRATLSGIDKSDVRTSFRATMARNVQETGRTGWYYRVLEPGIVNPTDQLILLDRQSPASGEHFTSTRWTGGN